VIDVNGNREWYTREDRFIWRLIGKDVWCRVYYTCVALHGESGNYTLDL
jgi:hypothetical protein